MKALPLFEEFKLPVDAVTETFGDIGKKGGGKTYSAQRRCETFMDARVQCVVFDPVGNWWGLRLAADGKSPGYQIPVFGGPKGDIPLEPTAGAFIAQVIVEKNISVILDVSRFRKGERKRFMADFAEEFFLLKKDAISPVHLFVEEAHVFVPQRVQKGEERMLGAMEDIVRIGRNYGIGCTLISQRAASVNKDVLTQVECLLAFQTSSKQDRKAITEWVSENDEDGLALLDSLKSLQKGEALFWSPSWLRRFEKVHITKKYSFDASSTPKVGQKRLKPKQLAPVELREIQIAMRETIDRLASNDVDKLKAKIRELQNKLDVAGLKTLKTQIAPVPPAKVKTVKVPWVDEKTLKRLERLVDKMDKVRDVQAQAQQAVVSESGNLRTMVKQLQTRRADTIADDLVQRPTTAKVKTFLLGDGHTTHTTKAVVRKERVAANFANGVLPKGEAVILTTVVQLPDGARREQLTVMTGYKRSSRDAFISRLKEKGLVLYEADRIKPTPEGRAVLGTVPPLPTGRALYRHWMENLPTGEGAILEQLAEAYPNSLTREALQDFTKYKRSSCDAFVSRLKARELVQESGRGSVCVNEILFD